MRRVSAGEKMESEGKNKGERMQKRDERSCSAAGRGQINTPAHTALPRRRLNHACLLAASPASSVTSAIPHSQFGRVYSCFCKETKKRSLEFSRKEKSYRPKCCQASSLSKSFFLFCFGFFLSLPNPRRTQLRLPWAFKICCAWFRRGTDFGAAV